MKRLVLALTLAVAFLLPASADTFTQLLLGVDTTPTPSPVCIMSPTGICAAQLGTWNIGTSTWTPAGGGGGGGSLSFPQTVAGTTTSGGVPYFSSTTQLSSSGFLTANYLMVGGGAGAPPSTVTTGTGVVTALGIAVNNASGFPLLNATLPMVGHCLQWGASGVTDAGGACTTGGGGGTVSSGNADQLTYYASTGTVVSGATTGTGVLTALGLATNALGGVLTTPSAACTSGQFLTFPTAGSVPTCATPAVSGLTVGATTIASGTNGYVQYNNGGILGEKSTTGTGNVVLSASPTFSGTIGGTGIVPFAALPSISANTVLGQVTPGVTTTLAVPGCSGTGQALNWTTGGGFGCAAAGGGGSAPYVNAVTTCSIDNTGVTDVTTSLNNCLSTYGSVALPAGTYLVSNCIILNTNGNLTGTGPVPAKGTTTYTGMVVTTVGGVTITSNSTTNSVVCLPSQFSGKINNFFVTKSVTATSGCGLDYSIGGTTASVAEDIWIEKQYYGVCANSSAYSVLSRLLVQNSLSHGIYFRSTATASGVIYQWELKDIVSQFNEGNGVYMNCPTGATNCIIGTPWYNVQSYSNTGGGFWFVANGTATLQDLELVSCVGSSDGNDELRVVGTISGSSGGYAKITGGLYELAGQNATGNFNGSTSHDAASNIGYGINILYMTNPIITNASIDDNSYDGMLINANSSNPTYGSIANNYINNNSRSAAGTFAGINIYGSQIAIMSILGNSSLTTPGFSYQKYGSTVTNTNASSVIMQTGNSETGTIAGCYTSGYPTFKPAGTGQLYNSGTLCP